MSSPSRTSIRSLCKAYVKLHRTHIGTIAGLVSELFSKLHRTASSATKDLAGIIMALTKGLSLQRTIMQGTSRKGFVTAAILSVLGLDLLEGD